MKKIIIRILVVVLLSIIGYGIGYGSHYSYKRMSIYNHTLGYQDGMCDGYKNTLPLIMRFDNGSQPKIECDKSKLEWNGQGYSGGITIITK